MYTLPFFSTDPASLQQNSLYDFNSEDATSKIKDACYKVSSASRSSSNSWYQTSKRNELLASIDALRALEADWDGEGACEIAPEAIAMAAEVVRSLVVGMPLPDIAPNPNGTVSLYWTVADTSIEFEVGRTRYSWAVSDHEGRVSHLCCGANEALANDHAMFDLVSLLPIKHLPEAHSVNGYRYKHEWHLLGV